MNNPDYDYDYGQFIFFDDEEQINRKKKINFRKAIINEKDYQNINDSYFDDFSYMSLKKLESSNFSDSSISIDSNKDNKNENSYYYNTIIYNIYCVFKLFEIIFLRRR